MRRSSTLSHQFLSQSGNQQSLNPSVVSQSVAVVETVAEVATAAVVVATAAVAATVTTITVFEIVAAAVVLVVVAAAVRVAVERYTYTHMKSFAMCISLCITPNFDSLSLHLKIHKDNNVRSVIA